MTRPQLFAMKPSTGVELVRLDQIACIGQPFQAKHPSSLRSPDGSETNQLNIEFSAGLIKVYFYNNRQDCVKDYERLISRFEVLE